PLPARTRHRGGDPSGAARCAHLLGRAGQTPRAGGKGPRAPPGRGVALCVPADCGARHGAQIGAPPHGVHVFCRQRGRHRGGATGPFGGQPCPGRPGAHFPNDRNREEARRTNMTWADFVVRGTLVLAAGFAASFAFGRASAAVRHLIWTAAFLALLALPVALDLGPKIPLAVWPAVPGAQAVRETVTVSPAPRINRPQ